MVRFRRSVTALLVAASPAWAAPARAQEAPATAPAPAAQTAPADPAADGRPVLPLTLEEAVKRALENNVDIAVERYNPESSELSLAELQGSYEPLLTSTITENSQTRAARDVFTGGATVDTDTLIYNFGAQKLLRTGGSFSADFNNTRSTTTASVVTFNPSFNSSFNLNARQPLLRNFSIDGTRYQIKVAKNNRALSDVQFRQTVTNTVASVKRLYYDLLYAQDNLEAQRKSLALASRLLEENRIKVRVGTMAPLDVVAAESEQASRSEAVIVAEAALLDAEDALKRAIFPSSDPVMWDTRIQPVDKPTAERIAVDAEAATRVALEKRTDVQAQRTNLETAELGIRFARNQTLPAVDLVANYGSSGLGGTLLRNLSTGELLTTPVRGGFGDALGDVFGRELPTWTFGINVSYPIFQRQADAAKARAEVTRNQTQANLRRLEMQVAAEVRTAARAVETNFKRVESTRAARVLAERRLDAETKKFAAGMSTNFLVTQSQRDLALAEVAEVRAVADYRKSIVDFERVQEAGVGGSGGVATVSAGRR